MSLPGFFETDEELILAEGDETDLLSFAGLVSATYPESRVFWLMIGQKRFSVIAAWYSVRETDLELLESGLQRTFNT